MTLRDRWRRDWKQGLAGLGVGVGVILLWLWRSPPVVQSGPIPARLPDGSPGGAAPLFWWLIEGGPVELEPGTTYRGCVRISAWNVARGLATPARIREGLEAEGFARVTVTETAPAGWFEGVECYRFVEATYAGARRMRERPGALAFAWRLGP